METHTAWRDSIGMIHTEPFPGTKSALASNAILFTITNWLLNDAKGILFIASLIDEHTSNSGKYFFQNTTIQDNDIAGHDNMTAMATALIILDFPEWVENLEIWPHYKHPRDIIYLAYLQGRIWAYPLLPILFFIFLWTALTKYKTRNGVKILKTDTEILYWIRTNLPEKYRFIHWTKFIIVPLLQRRFGKNYIKGMMNIYFKHPEHPNRLDADKWRE